MWWKINTVASGEDDRERKLNLRGMIYIFIVLFLSTLIVFVWEPRQVIEYVFFLEVFYFLDFGSLFLYGGLLGVLFTFLWSISHEIKQEETRLGFGLSVLYKSFIVVFLFPFLFLFTFHITLFTIMIFSMITLRLFFPFYGEGTFGSELVVLTLLAMYFGSRIMGNVRITAEATDQINVSRKHVLLFLLEILTAYVCTTAGFSIMGGLITDGIPPPLKITFDFVILIVFLLIPYSIFISRDKIYSCNNHHEKMGRKKIRNIV